VVIHTPAFVLYILLFFFCFFSYSNRPLVKTFRLTNSGRRHQQLMWSTEGFAQRPHKVNSNSKVDDAGKAKSSKVQSSKVRSMVHAESFCPSFVVLGTVEELILGVL
jgi:hypothetical protein